jgi:hypothetical protein
VDKAVLPGGGIRLSGPGRTAHAYLWFWGEDLEPDEVTAAMGTQPSQAWRRGDPARGREYTVADDGTKVFAPGRRTHKHGHWGVTFEPPEGLMADEVLAWLLDELEPHREAVTGLTARCTGEIVLSMRAEYSHVGIGFDWELLARLVALSLRLEVGTSFEPDPAVFVDAP